MTLARRDLLKLAAVGLVVPGCVLPGLPGVAFAADRPVEKRLVVLILRGAVDGLNVVPPWSDPAYAAARPGIGLGRPGAEGGALDLDGRFGLHPALMPLMPLWNGGQLAFVQACGSPDPTRSHFDAQKYLETGQPGVVGAKEGWMNRLLSALPGGGGPTRALAIGPIRPLILAGREPSTAVPLAGDALRPQPIDRPEVAVAFASLYQGSGALGDAFRQGTMARRELMTAMEADPTAAAGAPPPEGFPQTAERLARLLKADDHIQFAVLDLGGWDTHVNQGSATGQLAGHLDPLGQGLATFAAALGPDLDRTMVVVMSEFGRTVSENGSGGTDHGHGTVMWLLGGRVAGGKVHGRWPGLDTAALYEGRDLAVTTDFRGVLARVLERHLGLADRHLAAIFPGPLPDDTGIGGLFA